MGNKLRKQLSSKKRCAHVSEEEQCVSGQMKTTESLGKQPMHQAGDNKTDRVEPQLHAEDNTVQEKQHLQGEDVSTQLKEGVVGGQENVPLKEGGSVDQLEDEGKGQENVVDIGDDQVEQERIVQEGNVADKADVKTTSETQEKSDEMKKEMRAQYEEAILRENQGNLKDEGMLVGEEKNQVQ